MDGWGVHFWCAIWWLCHQPDFGSRPCGPACVVLPRSHIPVHVVPLYRDCCFGCFWADGNEERVFGSGSFAKTGIQLFFVFSFPNRPCSVLLRILTNCFYHGLIAKDSNPSRWWWWDDEAKTLLVVVVVQLRCNYRFHRICSRKALCPYSYMFL